MASLGSFNMSINCIYVDFVCSKFRGAAKHQVISMYNTFGTQFGCVFVMYVHTKSLIPRYN